MVVEWVSDHCRFLPHFIPILPLPPSKMPRYYISTMAHQDLPSPPPQRSKFLSSKPSILLFTMISLFAIPFLFQLQSLSAPYLDSSPPRSWSAIQQWGFNILTVHCHFLPNCSLELDPLLSKLRDSVTFLPIKGLRFTASATEGHTWFISSLNDSYESDEAEHIYLPSNTSDGRLLCLLSFDRSDGSRNSYTLAWRDSLPRGARLLEGLRFVSDSYYTYVNIWHGLSAMVPFVAWHVQRGCAVPDRWILYYCGELRLVEEVEPWVRKLMRSTYGDEMRVKGLEGEGPKCLEKAVVFCHNMGRMWKERKLAAYTTMPH